VERHHDGHQRPDRRPLLLARARTFTKWRKLFADRDFLEVDNAALQVSPGNEAHIAAFETAFESPGGRRPFYLHSSPEFACKKLLAAGETRIFDFARVFRDRERGPLHATEFTMLEWYRTRESYEHLMDDCAELLRLAAHAANVRELSYRGVTVDPFADLERLTLAEAFDRFAGIDLLSTTPDGVPDAGLMREQIRKAGIQTASDDTWGDMFSRVMVERVDPNLGIGRPTILCEYPVCEAALARPKASDPRVAERFELFACGVELANAFGELTDPAEQRRRFIADMDEKERIYGERYPLDEDFLAALASMPEASGIALGFDRLVMLATAAPHIDDVMWTPMR
jgi:lysyl-tRNA synthetase class 2